jgi:hypothetical protein
VPLLYMHFWSDHQISSMDGWRVKDTNGVSTKGVTLLG